MTHFQKALEIDPDFSDAQGNLGIALFREEKLDEAMPHLQRALELNPAYAKTYETSPFQPGLAGEPSSSGPQTRGCGSSQGGGGHPRERQPAEA